ncbi:MAG: class I SAM-dependent methyltransferase [Ardenticatenia bacterium]|nr:class I SAM-dependent methyltransferase [Ardenticatenia bacterium]
MLSAKFPDHDILRIHLTFERGYQDIDGMAHLSLYERFAHRLLTFADLPLDGDATVLDCACGSGYGSAFLRQTLKCRVQGVDVDHSTIAYAQKRYSQYHPHLIFSQGDAADLGLFRSDSVQAIVSIETIEHVLDDVAAIVEFRRVLAQGGALFITTPDSTERPGTLISDFHTREYTYSEFCSLLRDYFSEVEIVSEDQYLIAVCRK